MSILNPDPNQIINRITADVDNMIRQRIREYCTYDDQKDIWGELWTIADPSLKISVVDKDEKGWYIETTGLVWMSSPDLDKVKSFYDYLLSKGCKIDKQKGFLIEDAGIYFRWHKHHGALDVNHTPNFESTEGLPDELDRLYLSYSCEKSRSLVICNQINVIVFSAVVGVKISGNGCKNAIISPFYSCGNIAVPDWVKIHRPKDYTEYEHLIEKILGS